MACHRLGVALGLTMFDAGQGCLGDQRAQPGVIGIVGEMQELLVGHAQIGAHLGEAPVDGAQAPFEEHRAHDETLRRWSRCNSQIRDNGSMPSSPTALVAPSWGPRPRWGVACQLSAARSSRSWGIGDFADLAELGSWLRSVGGDVIAVSPLGDQIPVTPRQPSPYFGSSRRWLDPIHLSVEGTDPGGTADVSDLAAAARGLNDLELLDRSRVWEYKRAALRRIFEASDGAHDDDLDGFIERGGTDLDRHAHFCAWAERFGGGWTSWPEERAEPSALELRFWSWLQWQAAAQLRDAAHRCDLIGDLPVGVDPSGADAWADRDLMAHDWRIGAPPDEFNPAGQNWGIAPYEPAAFALAEYAPLRAVLASNGARFAGLRIDHILGMFRLWWVPPGATPEHGHYVDQDSEALLDVVLREALGHGLFVVGEDLGTVGDGVRERLARAGIAGMAVAWFEERDPRDWPEHSVGMLTTHDLPTVVGALSDPAEQRLADRIRRFAGCEDGSDPTQVLVEAHRRLAGSGSGMVLATLEDLCGSPHRVNLPGTIDSYPNWRHVLPVRLDDFDGSAMIAANVAAMDRR